jgi:sugar/nucleoside kinase (ribokinase family)
LGAKGASYNGKLIPQTNPKETIDVSGAGDTFTAAFILNYYKHKNVDKAITEANIISAIVVSKRGVATHSSWL